MKEHPDMTPDEVTEQIRAEVFKKAKISISAGIAPNARVFPPQLLLFKVPFNTTII